MKEERRRGWMERLGMTDVESVADHSYGVALLSLFEGIARGYNLEKVLKFAIVHDLGEAITGDMTPSNKRRKGVSQTIRMKEAAENRILEQMPTVIKEEVRGSWTELRNRKSREARLVKDLDRLEMALQASRYQHSGLGRRDTSEFYRSALKEIRDPALREVVRIVASSKLR